ncbi:MAG: hypothetical protein IJ566_07955 [Cardiobacteriaceae bacterium]|nr:hypothetical protein [Cardiobacteriaceae bacterium]
MQAVFIGKNWDWLDETFPEDWSFLSVKANKEEELQFLSGLETQSYDLLAVSGEVVEQAKPLSFAHWLRVLKQGGLLIFEETEENQTILKSAAEKFSFLLTPAGQSFANSVVWKKKAIATSTDDFIGRALTLEYEGKIKEANHQFTLGVLADPVNLTLIQQTGMFYQRQAWKEQAENLIDALAENFPYRAFEMYQWWFALHNNNYRKGFELREKFADKYQPYSRRSHACPPPKDELHHKRYKGEDLAGKRFLVWSEFGLGDEMMFAACAHRLKQLVGANGKLLWVFQPAIVDLMKTCPDIDEVLDARTAAEKITADDFDYWDFPHALPLVFKEDFSKVSKKYPYISARADLIAEFAEKIKTDKKYKIALAWRGDPKYENDADNDADRSIHNPYLFSILTELEDCEFYSVQKDRNTQEINSFSQTGIIDLAPEIRNFEDTAAIFANMDAVVAVDTSVIHLAGAMNVPSLVMLSSMIDWRWGLPSEHNLWYPSVDAVWRKSPALDWEDELPDVRERLAELLKGLGK